MRKREKREKKRQEEGGEKETHLQNGIEVIRSESFDDRRLPTRQISDNNDFQTIFSCLSGELLGLC